MSRCLANPVAHSQGDGQSGDEAHGQRSPGVSKAGRRPGRPHPVGYHRPGGGWRRGALRCRRVGGDAWAQQLPHVRPDGHPERPRRGRRHRGVVQRPRRTGGKGASSRCRASERSSPRKQISRVLGQRPGGGAGRTPYLTLLPRSQLRCIDAGILLARGNEKGINYSPNASARVLCGRIAGPFMTPA
jgi:hypothetical protein